MLRVAGDVLLGALVFETLANGCAVAPLLSTSIGEALCRSATAGRPGSTFPTAEESDARSVLTPLIDALDDTGFPLLPVKSGL